MESTQLLGQDLVERVREGKVSKNKSDHHPSTLFETTKRLTARLPDFPVRNIQVDNSNQEPSVLSHRNPKVFLGVPSRFREL